LAVHAKRRLEQPAGYVANFVEKDDLILFNATKVQIPSDYYFKAWEKQYGLQVEKHGVPVDIFDSSILEPKMTVSDIPRLNSLLSGHKRVWLVYSHDLVYGSNGVNPANACFRNEINPEARLLWGAGSII
jgi:hypothetical protein